MDKQLLGMYGEIIASRYLREHGYLILSAHYSSRMGEIDLIAKDKKYVCFVEVKTRSENMKYAPADAVDSAAEIEIAIKVKSDSDIIKNDAVVEYLDVVDVDTDADEDDGYSFLFGVHDQYPPL